MKSGNNNLDNKTAMSSYRRNIGFYKNLYPKEQWEKWDEEINLKRECDDEIRTIVGRKIS